jgi:hypothetical protein
MKAVLGLFLDSGGLCSELGIVNEQKNGIAVLKFLTVMDFIIGKNYGN